MTISPDTDDTLFKVMPNIGQSPVTPILVTEEQMHLISQHRVERENTARIEALQHAKQAWSNYLGLYDDIDVSDVSAWFTGYIGGLETKQAELKKQRKAAES